MNEQDDLIITLVGLGILLIIVVVVLGFVCCDKRIFRYDDEIKNERKRAGTTGRAVVQAHPTPPPPSSSVSAPPPTTQRQRSSRSQTQEQQKLRMSQWQIEQLKSKEKPKLLQQDQKQMQAPAQEKQEQSQSQDTPSWLQQPVKKQYLIKAKPDQQSTTPRTKNGAIVPVPASDATPTETRAGAIVPVPASDETPTETRANTTNSNRKNGVAGEQLLLGAPPVEYPTLSETSSEVENLSPMGSYQTSSRKQSEGLVLDDDAAKESFQYSFVRGSENVEQNPLSPLTDPRRGRSSSASLSSRGSRANRGEQKASNGQSKTRRRGEPVEV